LPLPILGGLHHNMFGFSFRQGQRDRNRPTNAYQISLQRWHIGRKHHPIRRSSPAF
jgi:hypothetical protein